MKHTPPWSVLQPSCASRRESDQKLQDPCDLEQRVMQVMHEHMEEPQRTIQSSWQLCNFHLFSINSSVHRSSGVYDSRFGRTEVLSLDVDGPAGYIESSLLWADVISERVAVRTHLTSVMRGHRGRLVARWTMMNYGWCTIAFSCYWILSLIVHVSLALIFVALNSGACGVSQQSWLLLPKDKGGNSHVPVPGVSQEVSRYISLLFLTIEESICRDELSHGFHGFQYITELQFLKHQPTILTSYSAPIISMKISYSLKMFSHVFNMFTGWEFDALSNGR